MGKQSSYAALLTVAGGLAAAGCGGPVPEASDSREFEAIACEAVGECGVGTCGPAECASAVCGSCDAYCGAEGCTATACGACAAFGDDVRIRSADTVTRPDPRPALDIPAYPTWPPEEASSRIDIGSLIPHRTDLSLYDAGQRLRTALNLAGYSEHSFYVVPGGFILVTQREQIDPEGRTMLGAARFQQPGEGRDASLLMRVRDLFLERPPSFYRYLAIVITDRPFGASSAQLSAARATDTVQRGSTSLSRDARDIAFADDFLAIALIYEYQNPGVGTALTMIEPGRIPPAEHLDRSGLARTLSIAFARNARP